MIAPWLRETKERKLELEEQSHVDIYYSKEETLAEIRKEHQRLEGFLTVITGQSISLPWPKLTTKKGNQECTLYFQKQKQKTDKFDWTCAPVNYDQIKENLGQLYCTWIEKHETFGPGFYLYLGVIKTTNAYVENQYANLIWGLESLHRRTSKIEPENAKLEQKIERILNSVESRDRKWLKTILGKCGEPSLKERIHEVFSTLPINFESKSLDVFCKSCADRRNDISHFGGERHDNGYDDFIDELIAKIEAIKYLYRAKLLQEIGIREENINHYLTKGPKSNSIKQIFDLAKIKLNTEQ